MEKIQKFVKKPVIIDAINFDGSFEILNDLKKMWGMEYRVVKNPNGIIELITIVTDSGDAQVNIGDWIIRGVKGEIYPCNAEVFELTYDEAPKPRVIPEADWSIDPIECHEPCHHWHMISAFFSEKNKGKSACYAYKKEGTELIGLTPVDEMGRCPLGKWVREGEENGT